MTAANWISLGYLLESSIGAALFGGAFLFLARSIKKSRKRIEDLDIRLSWLEQAHADAVRDRGSDFQLHSKLIRDHDQRLIDQLERISDLNTRLRRSSM